jgi:Domain of unknown function (DUF397)
MKKPTVADLGIDVQTQAWQRSGRGDPGGGTGAIEVAFVPGPGAGTGRTEWVLMRVGGDPAGRVLVYNRHEWECFLDGVRDGEFDDAAD